MISFIYPVKDSTLYKSDPKRLLNTGMDEILELTNTFSATQGQDTSRIIIQFDISSLVNKKDLYKDAEYYLNLKILESNELQVNSTIAAYPVSDSWEEGKGRYADSEYSYQGVSWKYRDSNLTLWDSESTPTDELGGGSWYDREELFGANIGNIECYYEIENAFSDIKIDVTQIVNYWISGEIDNNGLLLKFLNELDTRGGNLQFFSRNTNTIYFPHLSISYPDYYFNPCACESVATISCHPTEVLVPGTLTLTPDSGSLCLMSGSLDSGTLVSGSIDSGVLVSGSLASGSWVSAYWDNIFPDSGSLVCSLNSGTLDSGTFASGSYGDEAYESGIFGSGSLCLLVSGTSNDGLWFCPIESGSLHCGTLVSGSLLDGNIFGKDLVSVTCDTGSLELTSPVATEQYKYELETKHGNVKHIVEADVVPFIKNVRAQYRHNTHEKIKLGIRERYPTKTFGSVSQYDLNNFVTHPMYFSVRDAETEEIIIEFNKYSQISCDQNGHYFVFDFNCLSIGRMYKFLIQVESGMGSVIHEDERTFIVRS